MDTKNIFILETGQVLELHQEEAKVTWKSYIQEQYL